MEKKAPLFAEQLGSKAKSLPLQSSFPGKDEWLSGQTRQLAKRVAGVGLVALGSSHSTKTVVSSLKAH
jgi:hypothetical protein